MAARPATFKQADVKRALKAALDLGLQVAAFRIDRDGNIDVKTGSPEQAKPVNDWD